MKLITRDTDYAVRALDYISKKKNKVVSVSDLVHDLDVPRPFIRKILQILSRKKILRSYKGSGGGFLLAQPAEKIFLLDLVKIFQGAFKLDSCFLKKNVCSNINSCHLRKKILSVEKLVAKELGPVTLKSLN